MELVNNIILGFTIAVDPIHLLYCFVGVLLGTFIGVLPGIGALTATTLLLPYTLYLDPLSGIVMLAGIYYGSEYGGSISSILLNLPGTVGNAVTCIDGYPMSRQGRAGVALFVTAISSFIGGLFGIFSIVLFVNLIAQLGLTFGPAEYFSLMLLGLIAASTLAVNSPVKGFAMVLLGLLLSTIGTDAVSGMPRFYFNMSGLIDGISLIIIAIGFFGIAELINNTSMNNNSIGQQQITLESMIPTKTDIKESSSSTLRGSLIGVLFGALPGTGAAVAAFVSYSVEKKISKNPEKFGKGAIAGIASPEAANNAAAQSAFIPTLTLGIPGSATMAIILGALTIHGIKPGPLFISQEPVLFWGLIASFFIGNLILIILNIPLIKIWVSILRIPRKILFPIMLSLMIFGIYSINKMTFDIYLLGVIGIIAYILLRCGYEFAPLLLGFVLGPMMEENLRRALLIARGDITSLLDRPFTFFILSICLLLIIFSIIKLRKNIF